MRTDTLVFWERSLTPISTAAVICCSLFWGCLSEVGLLSSSVFRGNPFAFGWEGLWSHALVGLKPSGRPNWALPQGSHMSILKAKPYSFGRHSAFYQDPEIITDMTSWLGVRRDVESEIRS